MKIILLAIVLFFACGAAMILSLRLQQTQKRLADLHDQLRRNGEQMDEHRRSLERISAAREAEGGSGEVKS